MRLPDRASLAAVYGEDDRNAISRFQSLAERFCERFAGLCPEAYYSSPGRTEIIGNHVDHNGGRVLAASITLDSICAAAKTDDGIVRIISEGYDEIKIDLSALGEIKKCEGTLSLTAGLIEGLAREGYACHGFCCYATTDVIPSAGVSSSASYEMLIATVIGDLFHEGSIPLAVRARAGQYAENVWWEKASGMMDQMACAHGGTVLFDFQNEVTATPLSFTFDDIGCDMILVNSGKGHADLSAEYSSIPDEMRLVADALHGKNLCDSDPDALMSRFADIRAQVNNDRAMLRALHYYAECARVDEAVRSIREGRPEALLPLITASGNSSWKWLQSCYVTGEFSEQPVAVQLALTELFLAETGRGVCRINGGGFGGVMMCVLPREDTKKYVSYMTPFAGRDNIHVMGIRRQGAVRI